MSILLPGQSLSFPISPLPLTLLPSHVATSPPRAVRVPLVPTLPFPKILAFPPPLKTCLYPLLVLRHLSITWAQLYDGPSQLRRPFPVTVLLLLPGLSLSLPHFSPFVNPFIVPCSRQPARGGVSSSPISPSLNNGRLPNGSPFATSSRAMYPAPLGPSTTTARQNHKFVLQDRVCVTVRVNYHQPIAIGPLCSLLKRVCQFI